MRFLLVILMLVALPAGKLWTPPQHEVIGQMDLMIDGEAVELRVLNFPGEVSNATQIELRGGIKGLSVIGSSIDESGKITGPRVHLLIVPVISDTIGVLAVVDYTSRNEGVNAFATARDEIGRLELVEFSYTDRGELELDFTSEVYLTLLDDDKNLIAEEGAAPVLISGHVSVVIPEEFWLKE